MFKSLLICIVFSCGIIGPCTAQNDAGSTKWLNKGLAALVALKADPKNLTDSQKLSASNAMCWMNGFLHGLNASGVTGTSTDRSPLLHPPPEWFDTTTIAAKVLYYIESFDPKIPDDMPANTVMMSWYLANHPKSSEFDKALAKGLIQKQYSKMAPNR